MSKPSPRKIKKQKERQRQARQERLLREKRERERTKDNRYASTYPDFRIDERHGNPEFVKLIQEAISKVKFDDRTIFSAGEAEFYRTLKAEGTDDAFALVREVADLLEKSGNSGADLVEMQVWFHLGQVILDKVPQNQLMRFLPFNDVHISFGGRRIHATFRSLCQAKGRYGTIYYSRRKPTLRIDGVDKVVGFSRHAIERICERIRPRWITYAGLGDAFAYFDQCVYFERHNLHDGQLAFTFYDQCCNPPFWSHQYVVQVLGEDNVKPREGKCYYRVGYCPAEIEGDFVVAKTLLFPGFSQTPEYDAIQRFARSAAERRQLSEQAKTLSASCLEQQGDLGLIRWFHDHGVPQVVQMKQTVIAPLLSD